MWLLNVIFLSMRKIQGNLGYIAKTNKEIPFKLGLQFTV